MQAVPASIQSVRNADQWQAIADFLEAQRLAALGLRRV